MAVKKIEHLSLEERRARGKQARVRAPLPAHGGWAPAADRPDPVKLLEDQDTTREPDLVPVRHGRMMVSPFTFYRGSAKIMAADLAGTPRAGLDVQLCGDAHLSNFGLFASPGRVLLFDVNDFDETLPGPFEYDVKRLVASFTIAARHNGFAKADVRAVTKAAVAAYREAIASFAGMRTLDIWYARLAEDELLTATRQAARQVEKERAARQAARGKKTAKDPLETRKLEKRAVKTAQKARTRDSLQALSKLGEMAGGRYRIVSMPPVVVPFRDLTTMYGIPPDQLQEMIHHQFREYRASLQADRRQLLERFEIVDMARKVVGVGSVGTRAFIALLQGRDEGDPLFLQIKEATASVLEDHLPRSRYRQPGERVVQGQRLMQASSDIFLGWSKGEEANRWFYWRQLRDMKGSVPVETMVPESMTFYAGICGWTLARAHARSGDAAAIAAYLGTSDKFDQAITSFSERYAGQNERDYQAFSDAVHTGRITALEGV
ncbi:MAG TPA: DUF2252 domain-containing protein [Actinobacteria bacterium]|nr:DUF2252 domain-containing protein [Actinomycetota bacterium]